MERSFIGLRIEFKCLNNGNFVNFHQLYFFFMKSNHLLNIYQLHVLVHKLIYTLELDMMKNKFYQNVNTYSLLLGSSCQLKLN